jgi:hypothetical protein
MWWCYNDEGNGNKLFEKKKTTITSITFFNGFVAKKGEGNYCHLFRWLYYKEANGKNVVAFFYGGKFAAIAFFLFFFFFFYGAFGLIHHN